MSDQNCNCDDDLSRGTCCCGPGAVLPEEMPRYTRIPRLNNSLGAHLGEVPSVPSKLSLADKLGTVKARLGILRMYYMVKPGLYAVGAPTAESQVLVTANYKMSFDRLRSRLTGRDAWIMVLDTKGINVWCAAGKGTFGTDELVHRMEETNLKNVVSHRKVILPQLGAPGVSAHEVQRRAGFKVIYGPVRANDLPAFLDAGLKATPQMRRVEFTLRDRLAQVPNDLVGYARYGFFIMVCLFLLAGMGPGGYSTDRLVAIGLPSALLYAFAHLAGIVLTPAFLPWLPGRAFSSKGAWAGLLVALVVAAFDAAGNGLYENWLAALAWFLIIPAVASFVAMNFTGSSTYTSLSGVRAEMRIAVPLQVSAAVAGLGIWMAALFV